MWQSVNGSNTFKSVKWLIVKVKSVPSSFLGLPFLYLPNVFIHEPSEFIHVRVVNKLSKFKFYPHACTHI